jgi:hypothetical protein
MHAPEKGVIIPGDMLLRDAPGYDPLDLHGDAPTLTTTPLQLLVATTQEDWRGGRIDVTEFVAPASDVAMHFHQPMRSNSEGFRYGIASILATSSLAATVTYEGSADTPPRSGIYYTMPSAKGQHEYQLSDSTLVIGRPEIHSASGPIAYVLADRTDTEHAADAFRVVEDTDQLAAIVDRFGWALGLSQVDRDAFAGNIVDHIYGMRTYRKMKSLGGTIVSLRSIAALSDSN